LGSDVRAIVTTGQMRFGYSFGFNGQEADDEVSGSGNSYAFKYRMYDSRLGRFFSVDPLTANYPYYTPYQFAGNTPIIAMDLEGLEPKFMIDKNGKLTKPVISLLNAAFDFDVNIMEETTWRAVDFDFGLITVFNTVKYDNSLKNPGALDYKPNWQARWINKIAHEQEHRNEIGNKIGKAILWYVKYGLTYVSGGFSYRHNVAEERAYDVEFEMSDLQDYKDGLVMKLLRSDRSDNDKSEALKYVGLSYKLDKARSNLQTINSSLENFKGSKRKRNKIEDPKAHVQSNISRMEKEVAEAETVDVKKTISDVSNK
jgi:RHS repeat-associated protein